MNTYNYLKSPTSNNRPDAIVSRIGDHDFDIMVGLLTRLRPAFIVRELAEAYPADFISAGQMFDSCEHQVLLAAADYNLFCLADPSFDPVDELCGMLESDVVVDRINALPLSRAIDVPKLVAELTGKIQTLGPDQSKALWASLVFGQNAAPGMTDYEKMVMAWWTPHFITKWSPLM